MEQVTFAKIVYVVGVYNMGKLKKVFTMKHKNIPVLFAGDILKWKRRDCMSEILNAYDNYLTGRQRNIGSHFFYENADGKGNQSIALSVFHYAIEYLLGWDKETAVRKFDDYMVKKMRLEPLIQYISFPEGVENGSIKYILSLLYPESIIYHSTELIEELYQSVLKNGTQFPIDYFSGEQGFMRYCVCLRYVVSNYHFFHSSRELFDFFSSPAGNRFLVKYRLKSPASQMGINILEAVYTITKKDDPNSRFYLLYYSFMNELKHFPDAENLLISKMRQE